jgi:hypothetical protein
MKGGIEGRQTYRGKGAGKCEVRSKSWRKSEISQPLKNFCM